MRLKILNFSKSPASASASASVRGSFYPSSYLSSSVFRLLCYVYPTIWFRDDDQDRDLLLRFSDVFAVYASV